MNRRQYSILITGGAGFVGSHLADRLVHLGHRVTVLDDLSSGSVSNLEPHIGKGAVELVEGDIRDPRTVSRAASGRDVIVHLAAIVDFDRCSREPELADQVNAQGTVNLLETARTYDVSKFIYASSAAIYGPASRQPIPEDLDPRPISAYGLSKLSGEQHCLRYSHDYGLKVTCLRFFNIFGPHQSSGQYSGVVTEFMKRINRNEPPVIFGDGLQTRDFVNIKDAVEAITLSLNSERAVGTYNIATGRETTIKSLAQTLIRISGKALAKTHAPPREGEIRRSVANIGKAQDQLRFSPKTNLDSDLRDLWKWYSL